MKVRLLGIDYGEKRIGVALAVTPVVEPLTILSADEAVMNIKALIEREHIDAVVVGLSEGKSAERARGLALSLLSLGKPVYLADETLSSQEAREKLRQRGKRSKLREAVDLYAAAEILQEFVDVHYPLDELPKTGMMAPHSK